MTNFDVNLTSSPQIQRSTHYSLLPEIQIGIKICQELYLTKVLKMIGGPFLKWSRSSMIAQNVIIHVNL